MSLNRQGNNFHPDLPPCIVCGADDWRGNDTHMGHGVTAFYSCGTYACDGRAMAVFHALALLVLFEGPTLDDGCYRVPHAASTWMQGARQALVEADINECVHGDRPPPAHVWTPEVPSFDRSIVRATIYTGHHEWTLAQPGERVDLGGLFRARVADLRSGGARVGTAEVAL